MPLAWRPPMHYCRRPKHSSRCALSKFLEIAALIVLPLAWGLLVEYLFERLRRRRSRRSPAGGKERG